MKKSDKEIEEEVNKLEEELLSSPAIDQVTKKLIKEFRKSSKQFAKEIDEITEYINKYKKK
jgi:predicted transcriptional regulator